MKISDLRAFEVLDSRGVPTVMAEVTLESGIVGVSCVPSGASTGSREAVERRDGDAARYGGLGVQAAVDSVNTEIRERLLGAESAEQRAVDETLCALDGSEDKSRLGANALLAVSLAVARSAAAAAQLPLYRHIARIDDSEFEYLMPVPMMNILNGGVHAANNVDIQECMIVPVSATSFREALRHGAEVYRALRDVLAGQGLSVNVGDEGGFAPDLPSNEAALEAIDQAVERAGFRVGGDIGIALDLAANELLEDGRYRLRGEGRDFDAEGFVDYLAALCERHPILSLEDGLGESDWDGWALLSRRLGERLQLVGDDLFVTNTRLLKRGIDAQIANAILIKCNQIGTLSETLDALNAAREAGYRRVVSHRSGETEDTMIADLAVATSAGQIKAGAPCRTDRVAKYNRLLRIEAELAGQASYLGKEALAPRRNGPD